jgi:NADH-quinone oxidoreductase subunit A
MNWLSFLSDASASNSAANYFPIGVQLIFAAGFVATMIACFGLGSGPKRKTADKLETFASGIEPMEMPASLWPSNTSW